MTRIINKIEYTEEAFTNNMRSMFNAMKIYNYELDWETFKKKYNIIEEVTDGLLYR